MSALLVLCTCPDDATARSLASSLVEAHVAACVSILPGLRSVYRWQGRIESAEESLLLIKTTRACFPALELHIVGMHPCTLPEVLGFEVATGLEGYLRWVDAETMQGGVPA